ncbi:ZIP family metal transporter [Candidatus Pacearchaeota archaeon CG10_big_fil_rev_8_21_14_0_10_32_14]|nr:MAG: ZIP family metal transporter [Candidatus Pacearchaeota archaeon CG10_big_fil_rev_8_21_14_0_10_32_14]
MNEVWLYSLLSVFIVSLISLIGIFTFSMSIEKMKRFLIYLISFSAGALFGDAFIHLLPEVVDEAGGFTLTISISLLSGIVFFFIIEKIIHWNHCHMPIEREGKTPHVHTFSIMNLIGDGVHNFIDGLIIGVSYVASIPVGIATTLAVILHEIPQEIGDFGVLIYGGFTKKRALTLNFASALISVIGAIVALIISTRVDNLLFILLPFAAGGFIYIAGSDLIPELHNSQFTVNRAFWQLVTFVLGILTMMLLILLE